MKAAEGVGKKYEYGNEREVERNEKERDTDYRFLELMVFGTETLQSTLDPSNGRQ